MVTIVVISGSPRAKPGSSGITRSTKSASVGMPAKVPKATVSASSRSPAAVATGGGGGGGGVSPAELKFAQEESHRLAEENQRLQGQVGHYQQFVRDSSTWSQGFV